ncbi:hypothetical protein [Deferrisoma palaeochoriense]
MVRVLFEISLPEAALEEIAGLLEPGRLAPGAGGGVQFSGRGRGCEGPAVGGDARWTPCWITLEWPETPPAAEARRALEVLKRALAAACEPFGLELRAIPATAQVGDAYLRFKDLPDVADELE